MRLSSRYVSTYRTTLDEILATNNGTDFDAGGDPWDALVVATVAAVAPEPIMLAFAASSECPLMFFYSSVNVNRDVNNVQCDHNQRTVSL